MNSHVPFDACQLWGNTYGSNCSNDPLVDKLIGNAYHVVRTVYCNLGNLKLLYDYLTTHGMVVGVQSEVELKALPKQFAKFARIYNFASTGDRQVTDYLYVDDDASGIKPGDPTLTGSWIKVAVSGSTGGGEGGGEGAYIPYVYQNGSATGGETSFKVPEETVGVPFLIINGSVQYIGFGFTYNVATATVTLSNPLVQGDEVIALTTAVPANPDNPDISGWVQVNWLYNNGSAVGGEQVITVPYSFKDVPAVYKNGLRLYKGLQSNSYVIDPDTRTVTMTEILAQGDRVIVTLGGESETLMITDRTLQEVARATNVKDSDVVLSSTTNLVITGKKVLYDVAGEKHWYLPVLPPNAYIVKVVGDKLTYNPGSVEVRMIDPIWYNQAAELGLDIVGFFEDGVTVTKSTDALVYLANGLLYSWGGALPKVVSAGTNPLLDANWIPQTDPNLRDDLASSSPGKGASMVYDAAKSSELSNTSATSLGDALIGVKQPFTGARDMTQHLYNALYLNAQHFEGVTGVNGDDQTAGLQAAINAAAGGTLYIPHGAYGVSDYLTIPSNTHIKMDPNARIYRLTEVRSSTGTALDGIILNQTNGSGGYSANSNITLEGGIIDGNPDFITSTPASPIAFGHCTNVNIINVTVLNTAGAYHAIECNSSLNVMISGCIFMGSGLNGSEAVQIDGMIDDGRFPWFGPYDNTSCTNVTIKDCYCTGFGWFVASHSAPGAGGQRHQRIKILNNESTTYRGGIRAYSWTNVIIDGNNIIASLAEGDIGTAGIYLNWVSAFNLTDIRISNNTCYNWTNGAYALWVRGNPTAYTNTNTISICNNHFYSSSLHTVNIQYVYGLEFYGNDVATAVNSGYVAISLYAGDKITFSANRINGDVRIGNNFSEGTISVSASSNHITGTTTLYPNTNRCTFVGNRTTTLTNSATDVTVIVASNSVG